MSESPINPEEVHVSPEAADSVPSLSLEEAADSAVSRSVHLPLGGANLKEWTTEGQQLRQLFEKKD